MQPCHSLASKSSVNKMTAFNLAVVFGPTLLKRKSASIKDIMSGITVQNAVGVLRTLAQIRVQSWWPHMPAGSQCSLRSAFWSLMYALSRCLTVERLITHEKFIFGSGEENQQGAGPRDLVSPPKNGHKPGDSPSPLPCIRHPFCSVHISSLITVLWLLFADISSTKFDRSIETSRSPRSKSKCLVCP